MIAHDLYNSRIEYVRDAIDLDRKDRVTSGATACAARSIPYIFNLQFSIPVYPDLDGMRHSWIPRVLPWESSFTPKA